MAFLIKPEKKKGFDANECKAEFCRRWRENVHREGSEKFLEYLLRSDFFTAPASTKFHSNVEGGLCYHSLIVDDLFETELKNAGIKITPLAESKTIAALGHDACKIDFYKWGERNVKDELGQWHAIPNITIEEKLPFGHGEKSVYILQSFMNLTREEALAIRWHMGDFTEAYGGCTKAYNMSPFTLYLHIADIKASNLVEGTYNYLNDTWS